MAANVENSERRIVPRWRTSESVLATRELSVIGTETLPSIDGSQFLAEKEANWLTEGTLVSAADLVSASILLGNTRHAQPAAEFILANNSSATVIQLLLARTLLGIKEPLVDSTDGKSRPQIYRDIQDFKNRSKSQSKNAFVWADLARLYAILGQIEPARRAIRIALNLAPVERFIVRSATRFFLHANDPEQALHLLRKNQRTPQDPWLIAPEIAISSILQKGPTFERRGRELLTNRNIAPFHNSELASALGSLEMLAGSDRKANKLFLVSLADPTDNSLAQVVWASKRTGFEAIPRALLKAPHSSEANTLDAYNRAQWKDVLINAEAWAQDESFYSRPRLVGSAVASMLLDQPEEGLRLARIGLETNPSNATLMNNAAFALIEAGRPKEAFKELDSVNLNALRTPNFICIAATKGLAYFRTGYPTEGREYYGIAINAAKATNSINLLTLAKLYFARELILHGDPVGPREFETAYKDALRLKGTDIPYIAEHLALKVKRLPPTTRPQ
jgi:tetratricopeptide (TPR) repeat protein